MENKFVLNRLGLINFWYYQNQVFELSDGHLLFRGRNGAGKSITMQSLMPILLDGNVEPSRLDSFGSRDKKMIDYFLGDVDVNGKNKEGVGYLWAEYKIGEQYITTGIGMHGGRKSTNLNRWYFVINDGRRIGSDFSLMINETTNSAITLSKKQLKNRIEGSGQVFNSQKEYANYISENIFGFKNIDDLENTIKLLIQLRNPKLNNDLKPAKLESILSDSLPSLTEDNVQASARTLDQIDQANANIDQIKYQKKELQPLLEAYTNYRHHQLVALAHVTEDHLQQAENLTRKLSQLDSKHREIENRRDSINESNIDLGRELDSNIQLKEKLAGNEGFNLVEEAKKLNQKLSQMNQNKNNKNGRISIYEGDIKKHQDKISDLKKKEVNTEEDFTQLSKTLEYLAVKSGFGRQHKQIFLVASDYQSIDIAQWKKDSLENLGCLEKIVNKYQECEWSQKNVNQLDRQLEDENKKLDDYKMKQRNWESQYDEELFNLKQMFQKYSDNLSFEIDKDVVGIIQTNLDQIYTRDMPRLSKVIEPLIGVLNEQKGSIQNSIQEINYNIDNINVEIEGLQTEQDEIRAQKYPVPERLQHRKKIRQNQELIPFYQFLEFKENIDTSIANQIEGALLESGILDGLVSPDGEITIGDTTLQANPKMFMPTLMDYLKPDIDFETIIPESLIYDLLSSIAVNKDSTDVDVVITPDGEFQVGILVGQAKDDYEAQFIGATAQERFRKSKIEDLQKRIDDRLIQLKKLENSLTERGYQIDALEKDIIRIPKDDNLSQLKFRLDDINRNIESQTKTTIDFSERLEHDKEELQRDFLEVKQLSKNYQTISKSKSAFELAKNEMQQYINSINDWSKDLSYINNLIERIKDVEESLIRMGKELIVRQKELSQIISDIKDIQSEIKVNEDRQRIAGNLDGIKKRLVEIGDRIDRIRYEQKENNVKLQDLAGQSEKNKTNIVNIQKKLDFERPFSKLLVETLDHELYLEAGSNQDLKRDLKNNLITDEAIDSENLNHDIEIMNSKFSAQSNSLLSFRPRQKARDTLDAPDWIKNFPKNKGDIDFWKLYLNHHQEVLVELSGVDELITKLDNQLKEQIQVNREAMTEAEEELFRAIIFDSLGEVIRQNINKAQDWIVDMNQILSRQENNSNLKLSIKWEIKPSDELSNSENQEGVALLKKDPKVLNHQDLAKIKSFLNSKINEKKIAYEDHNQEIQMTKILRDSLDYRQWFQFKIFYTQNGKNKRQLTKVVFNKFSGGEKAITMYTPLFVAMSARYNNAHEIAPRIITLDEAFAGIDESNISQLFKTIDQLGFNYIMTSQQLQAEYDTVPSLNTYELLRDKGKDGDLVTAIQLHWDGKKRIESNGY
ncbi:TIGR02680 family protein [Companilactobacillus muriivasis]|uniref:TIGR02680 family protein n=1 Tax=Companilactobacillus muriivasis TaxID=3081444 RepID=UPI0030C71827